MDSWERNIAVLPADVKQVLINIPLAIKEQAQEIRLRKNRPLALSLPKGDWEIPRYICTVKSLYNTFVHVCDHSVHSHQQELRNGYICAKNGCRIGVAGTAVLENGEVVSIRDISALCLRITRPHLNCAKDIAFTIKKSRLHSVLICGEPASGKTSLLRDLIRLLTVADGEQNRLAVVDERGELVLQNDPAYDVLTGFPKVKGIEQALRTLSPEGIVFDELGNEEEVKAVLHCLNSGVASICSLHADGVETLKRRPAARAALQSGAFDYVVLLAGRRFPGQIDRILSAKEITL